MAIINKGQLSNCGRNILGLYHILKFKGLQVQPIFKVSKLVVQFVCN